MFPPQGAPQPGAVSQGGGITPQNALSVRNNVNKYINAQHLYNYYNRKFLDSIKQ
jgi:hypothetical protein